jgi:hypothetical protein
MNRSMTLTALALLGLLAGAATPYAAASPVESASSSHALIEQEGLAKRVVVTGLCSGHGHYRLILSNTGSGGNRLVDADLTIRGAGKRTQWAMSIEATTIFGDGTAVTGIGDGFATADRHGVISTGGATPAGVRHTFEFSLSRDGHSCLVSVSA